VPTQKDEAKFLIGRGEDWMKKLNLYGKKSEGTIRSSFLLDVAGKLQGVWYGVSPKDTIPKALEVLKGEY
jgi:peroxiredoxin Q/BCP